MMEKSTCDGERVVENDTALVTAMEEQKYPIRCEFFHPTAGYPKFIQPFQCRLALVVLDHIALE